MKEIFAEYNDRLFIRADRSGIHQLILISDSFIFYLFKGSRYLDACDVLKWHEKELKHGIVQKPPYLKKNLNKYREMIKILTKAIADFKKKKGEENG